MKHCKFPSYPVLLVDDDAAMLQSFRLMLNSCGINNVVECQDSREVMPLLAREEIDIVLLDLSMPYVSGQELLGALSQNHPDIPVIVITGTNEVETAVNCMRSGALDYMVKPIEKSRLISGVKNAVQMRVLERENRLLKERVLTSRLYHPEIFSDIITSDKKMHSLFRYIEAIAGSSQPVLITGETGTGKELIARAIHKLNRRAGPFVAVNLAGLDDHLFADTLFGHARGAFTGADKARKGLVESAAGGTLFLDEIGDLHLNSQVKLLRLLQEGEYMPLGSDIAKRCAAHIVVATNLDLQSMQKSGKFRRDLYYRLRTHHLHIPPLRERMDDLSLLVAFFFEEAARSTGKKKPTPPKEILTLLKAYHFPGNIRELRSMIFDAVGSHVSGQLSLERIRAHIEEERASMKVKLSPSPRTDDESEPLITFSERLPTIRQANYLLVAEAMRRMEGNQSMVARFLGITRQTLSKYLKSMGERNDP